MNGTCSSVDGDEPRTERISGVVPALSERTDDDTGRGRVRKSVIAKKDTDMVNIPES